jgi:hypothetical protein
MVENSGEGRLVIVFRFFKRKGEKGGERGKTIKGGIQNRLRRQGCAAQHCGFF